MANERYSAAVTGILQQHNVHVTDVKEKDGVLIVSTDTYAVPGYVVEQLIKAGREENKATPVVTIVSIENPTIKLLFPL